MKPGRTMLYLKNRILRRVLQVVTTFILIYFLSSTNPVYAQPQQKVLTSKSKDNNSGCISECGRYQVQGLTTRTGRRPHRSLAQTTNSFLKKQHFTQKLSLLDKRLFTQVQKCMRTSGASYRASAILTKLFILYLNKIKTKIKFDFPVAEMLEKLLLVAFQQVKFKNRLIANYFKLMDLLLFIRLFTVFKTCRGNLCKLYNQNAPSSDNLAKYHHADLDHDIESCCRFFICIIRDCKCPYLFDLLDHQQLARTKRDLSEDHSSNSVEEGTPYMDNSYRDTLIDNFFKNSLLDLKTPGGSSDRRTTVYSTSSKPLMVQPAPKPLPAIRVSSSTNLGDWSIQSTTDLYPVPLITIKPDTLKLYQYLRPATSYSDQHSWYPVHNYPERPPPSYPEDIHLEFPHPITSISYPSYNEPFFVEPIAVSSVDQLPTNYPIPMENASLSHNPITVMVGSKPPNIVVLEDYNFQLVAPPSATTAVEEDLVPPAAAAAPVEAVPVAGSAVGPIAAGAAATAGLGALGTLEVGAGVLGAVAGGVGAGLAAGATSSAASSAAGSPGDGADGLAEVTAGLGVSIAPTDAVVYSPNPETELDLEAAYGDFADFLVYVFSFRFLRILGNIVYMLIIPHVSLLLTSGFTIVGFFFPWVYPHIVVLVISFLSNFT